MKVLKDGCDVSEAITVAISVLEVCNDSWQLASYSKFVSMCTIHTIYRILH